MHLTSWVFGPYAFTLIVALLLLRVARAEDDSIRLLDRFIRDSILPSFLPGHLWTAPLILFPKGNNNSYCYNPSFARLDGIVHAYVRCHSRDYFNPRYRRYHTSSWAMIEGGMNRFVLSALPYNIRDLRTTVQAWRDVEVPLERLPGHSAANRFVGLQDARIFSFRDRLWFVAASQRWEEAKKGIDDYGPIVGYLRKDRSAVEDLWMPRGMPDRARNIVPFTVGENIFLVDVLAGLLFRLEGPEYRSAVAAQRFRGLETMGMRGGTNPILLDGGTVLGMIAHSVYKVDTDPAHGFGSRRIDEEYLHFWIELTVDTGDMWISRPFFLMSGGIEFASSLALTSETEVAIGMGLNDQEAWVLGASLSSLRAQYRVKDSRRTAAELERDLEQGPGGFRSGSSEGSAKPVASPNKWTSWRPWGSRDRGSDAGDL